MLQCTILDYVRFCYRELCLLSECRDALRAELNVVWFLVLLLLMCQTRAIDNQDVGQASSTRGSRGSIEVAECCPARSHALIMITRLAYVYIYSSVIRTVNNF